MSAVAKIYIACHKSGQMISDSVFTPIHVGAAISKARSDILRDDVGVSISEKNKEFCELTAIYWAWKNDVNSNWIGFMHYRRFLDFSMRNTTPDIYGCVNINNLDATAIKETGLNADSVLKLIEKDVNLKAILPKKWSVKNIGFENIYQHYAKADFHFRADLDAARGIIARLSPEYINSFDLVMSGDEAYFTNIFVFRRDVFEEYCDWLFRILFELELNLDFSHYSTQSRRVIGYIAERLLSVFLCFKNFNSNELIELNRTFFANTTELNPWPKIIPYKGPDHVTVAIPSDDNFVPHLAALIESIKFNISGAVGFDICILDGGISEKNKVMLEKQFGVGKNFDNELHFINCKGAYLDVDVHMHFATPTFYRLNLGDLLPEHKKVIYLDSDMIVEGDLSDLWKISLDDKVLGACHDLIIKKFVARNNLSMADVGGQPTGLYLKNYLNLKNDGKDYFQAGFLLMDLDRCRQMNLQNTAKKLLKVKKFWFLDQDVLNIIMEGKVKFIDTSWNCVNTLDEDLSCFDAAWREKIINDMINPKIIHYAGFDAKPWNNSSASLANHYWRYLRKTYWYDQIVFQSRNNMVKVYDASILKSIRRIYLAMPLWVRLFLNPVKSVFFKLIR